MAHHAFGIDLGTTYSQISTIFGDFIDIISDKRGKKDIPSRFQLDSSGNYLIGNNIHTSFIKNPIIYDTKRMLGRKYDDEFIQEMIHKWPFKITKSDTDEILICANNSNKRFRPYEISGEILKHLINIGNERFPDQKTNKVVITVPANFGDEERMETLQAAKYAKLEVLSMINEPTAVSLAVIMKRPDLKKYKFALVYDFGGGTLDVSLISFQGSIIKVIGTDGDMSLGGRDFDEKVLEFFLNEKIFDQKIRKKKSKLNELIKQIEDMKIALSTNETTEFEFDDGITKGKKTYKLLGDKIEVKNEEEEDKDEDEDEEEKLSCQRIMIDNDFFEKINKDLISRLLSPVIKVLKESKINKEDVDLIILAGGSSNMKSVRKTLTKFFNKEPINGIDPTSAVSTGAGILANKIVLGEKLPIQFQQFTIHDICPFSIGTTDFDTGQMDVFIKKGTTIPTNVSKSYSTILYRQEMFTVYILEGEKKLAKDNKCIGEFTIPNLPQTEMNLNFVVTFSIDQNGVLIASAKLDNFSLNGSTSIDIKKSKLSMKSEERDKVLEAMCSKHRNLKLLCMNIMRYIDYNEQNFRDCDVSGNVDLWREKMKKLIDKIDNNESLIENEKDIISDFKNTFQYVFHGNEFPFFLA